MLKGERLIQQGKYELALEQLQAAVRLIPTNAQAWNQLGLAFHYNKQPKEALKAYRQALALDRKLSIVHYNVGCVLLEQDDPAGAVDPLTSYTYLQPRSAPGWLKLATAQLRARKFEAAETNFKRVLELEPQNAEALNGLGVAQAQRKRPLEALASFNQAVRKDPRYGPALLNAALVSHQLKSSSGGTPTQRVGALQKLRDYLAMQPPPPPALKAGATALANSLETELTPPKSVVPAVFPTTPSGPVALRTNPIVSTTTVIAAASSNTVGLQSRPYSGRTNVVLPASPKVVIQAGALTNQPRHTVSGPTNTEVISALAHPVPPRKDLEVTKIAEDPVINPANSRIGGAPASYTLTPNLNPDRRTPITGSSPFAAKPKPSPAAVSPMDPDTRVGASLPPAAPRYSYLHPRPSGVGDRTEATRLIAQGVTAHRSGRISEALGYYQRATQLDPAYFEAHYNFGLALYESGNIARALGAFETALALRADSPDARYNFALALKRANYLQDAAEQLEKILKEAPAETRAHLSLGNLYSQKLNRPSLARTHYLSLLKKEPRHPQAAEIRYWLASHP